MLRIRNAVAGIKVIGRCLGVCILISFSQPLQAKILNVPSEYKTILDAVLRATDGDEVVVAPGVYNEQINSAGLNITIRSTFNGDWSVVQNTIIDTYSNGVATFSGRETEKCVLHGFTLRGGRWGITGQGTHATIEYNIISNCMTGGLDPFHGIIHDCDGLIQNNVIENNVSGQGGAFRQCDGTIQNNLIRGNRTEGGEYNNGRGIGYDPGLGGAFMACNGLIRNNTVVDNFNYNAKTKVTTAGGFHNCKGTIVNNLVYHTTMTLPLEFDENSTPTYCLFRDPHAGQGNITGDPKFVDPKNGDYRLQPGSPAIGAGAAQSGLKYDLQGFPRAVNSSTPGRGDGSGTGIGAYDPLPRPVAVWLPYGGPPGGIQEGQSLAISWALETQAGNTLRLRLYKHGYFVSELGTFTAASGAATITAGLPASLYSGSDYGILGYTPTTPVYSYSTPWFSISGTRVTAVEAGSWWRYE